MSLCLHKRGQYYHFVESTMGLYQGFRVYYGEINSRILDLPTKSNITQFEEIPLGTPLIWKYNDQNVYLTETIKCSQDPNQLVKFEGGCSITLWDLKIDGKYVEKIQTREKPKIVTNFKKIEEPSSKRKFSIPTKTDTSQHNDAERSRSQPIVDNEVSRRSRKSGLSRASEVPHKRPRIVCPVISSESEEEEVDLIVEPDSYTPTNIADIRNSDELANMMSDAFGTI